VLLGETLGIGCARAVPADQGHRACHQPKHGVETKQVRHDHAQAVLQGQEWEQDSEEAQQAGATQPQQGKIGRKADFGKENQQQRSLCRGIEGEREPRRSPNQEH
jgi:hypothetical protein